MVCMHPVLHSSNDFLVAIFSFFASGKMRNLPDHILSIPSLHVGDNLQKIGVRTLVPWAEVACLFNSH